METREERKKKTTTHHQNPWIYFCFCCERLNANVICAGKWITTHTQKNKFVVMIFFSMDYFIVLCCCCCCRLQFFYAACLRGLCSAFAPHFLFIHTLQLAGLAEMLFGRVKLLIIHFSSFLVVYPYCFFFLLICVRFCVCVFVVVIFGCFGSRLLFSIFWYTVFAGILFDFFAYYCFCVCVFFFFICWYSCHFFTYIYLAPYNCFQIFQRNI